MILLLKLFWEFLKVGLFTFGGGYGAIPLIRDALLQNPWMGVDDAKFTYIVGVAESTPGPIMINTATYIGTTVAGPVGAIVATLGAITPSVIIILLIASLLKHFMEKQGTRAVLDAIKPCVVGIILSTGIYFLLSGLLPRINSVFTEGFTASLIPQWRTVLVFALVGLARWLWKLIRKKPISPVLSIGIAAALGIAIYGV
ncbi:MAG: chromate transporter [Clostridia bacterium]|nr:chromate transporter [Clostridia bacterium]